MDAQNALETVIDAARSFAQLLADDADKSADDEAVEAEIWEALDVLAALPMRDVTPSREAPRGGIVDVEV